ncbi:MAG: hypothetical protein QOD72_2511 [Acidimicrobiaceae bacterium]|jgi:hypothetical protein|nr:hypothetical protein [Acidimicrobiaceae bacterium]
MAWLHQHVMACVLVAVVLVGAALFAVSLPQCHASSTTVTVEMATQHQYRPADFRAQFAAQGIALRRVRVLSGVTLYGDVPAGAIDDGFMVSVYPKHAKVMFDSSGPQPLYQARLGNVTVSYGGHDTEFAARVTAAVSAIKR